MHFRSLLPSVFVGALFLVLFAGVLIPQVILAQSATDQRRAELQAQLNKLEKEIADNQAIVDSLAAQGKSLSNEVKTLNAKIKAAQLQVQATQVAIKSLDSSIRVHENTITSLTDKLAAEKASLAQILRRTNEVDNYSLVEIAFASEDLSTVLGTLDTYAFLKRSLAQSYEEITGTKLQTLVEKEALENKRQEQLKIQDIQLLAKKKVVDQQTEKQTLLTTTKGQESAYRNIVSAKQKTAGQIRAELFSLAGGSGQIPLPTAIALAKTAGAATGVRPAFVLAIMKQETNLGQNVGQCLLTNTPNKGDGKGKNTGTFFDGVMKPTRDVDPFMAITSSLGLDWQSQPVSCPPSYGYGGAMGPGQFIPSTWILIKDRVARAAGHPGTPANPWNNLDAFTATALYVADLGAAAQTPTAERTAALKYFAGGNYTNPAYAFYGDSVMGFADQFQSDIQVLGGN